jgi:hypothetical protein
MTITFKPGQVYRYGRGNDSICKDAEICVIEVNDFIGAVRLKYRLANVVQWETHWGQWPYATLAKSAELVYDPGWP